MLRASGGISILVKKEIPATQLGIKVPEHIETLWLSLRPHWLPREASAVIVAVVYYPGSNSIYAPNQEDIILHLTETVLRLKESYDRPLFVITGDFNDLKIEEICDACKLQQVVKVPTRKNATLDLILTNKNYTHFKNPRT